MAKPAVATPPANAPASVPEPGIASSLMAAPEFYRIRPGDTGSRIARTYQLTLTELLALNPGVQWGRLKVGQQIRLHAAK